jgi:hypothetical protein
MSKSSSPTLTCAQCGYENEPERVYCHNCGTKLDRSVLPVEAESPQESMERTRKRILKMTRPGGQFGAFVGSLFKTVGWAAVVAALILIALPPEGVPKKNDEINANIISGMIEEAALSPRPSTIQVTGIDLSAHARTRIKGSGAVPGLKFKRSFVVLAGDTITLGFEQTLFDYPLYSTATYRVKTEDGKVVGQKVGQHYGRLGIPPEVPGLDGAFVSAWKNLKTERQVFERAQSATIADGKLTIITGPAAPAAPAPGAPPAPR